MVALRGFLGGRGHRQIDVRRAQSKKMFQGTKGFVAGNGLFLCRGNDDVRIVFFLGVIQRRRNSEGRGFAHQGRLIGTIALDRWQRRASAFVMLIEQRLFAVPDRLQTGVDHGGGETFVHRHFVGRQEFQGCARLLEKGKQSFRRCRCHSIRRFDRSQS